MSEEEARKLNLDQLWLDPSLFNDDFDFASSTQSRQHGWQQQQSELNREQGSGKAAGPSAPTPGPANSSITPTEIPVRAQQDLQFTSSCSTSVTKVISRLSVQVEPKM